MVPPIGGLLVELNFHWKKLEHLQAPKFLEPIQPCVVVEGDTCTFSAVIAGSPAPEVAWLKNKQDLVMTNRHQVQSDPRNGRWTLTIRQCGPDDTGVYSCRASNTSGRATCTANVVVVRKLMLCGNSGYSTYMKVRPQGHKDLGWGNSQKILQ